MASYNKVILMGNLTRDPELRFTQANMAICKIGLAVNRRWLDKNTNEWKEEPTFIDVTIFGKRGEAFAKYHTKGKPAFIEGSLRLDNWQDKDGNKRSKLYVVADEWQFVSGGSPGGGGGGGFSGGGGEQRGGYSAPQPASSGPSYDEGPGADFLDADDTPF
ncbi:MAG: single-stranded DNA-binding protein [Planctomycetota bacterium]